MELHASRSFGLAVTLVLTALCPLASARQDATPMGEPAQPREPADQPVLRGPKVEDQAARTLLRSDMQGRFLKVDGRPEEAAVAQIPMDPGRREQARALIADRASALMTYLVDNIDLIKETTDATKSGDTPAAQRIARDLYDRFDPAHSRDPLLAPLATVLMPEETAELKRLADEYWKGWIDAQQRSSPKATREAIQGRLQFELFQTELRTAYDYTLRPYQIKIDRICEVTDATPEQRAAIRDAVISYIKAARLRPSDEQRAEFAKAIYSALDEERRIRLLTAALSAL